MSIHVKNSHPSERRKSKKRDAHKKPPPGSNPPPVSPIHLWSLPASRFLFSFSIFHVTFQAIVVRAAPSSAHFPRIRVSNQDLSVRSPFCRMWGSQSAPVFVHICVLLHGGGGGGGGGGSTKHKPCQADNRFYTFQFRVQTI